MFIPLFHWSCVQGSQAHWPQLEKNGSVGRYCILLGDYARGLKISSLTKPARKIGRDRVDSRSTKRSPGGKMKAYWEKKERSELDRLTGWCRCPKAGLMYICWRRAGVKCSSHFRTPIKWFPPSRLTCSRYIIPIGLICTFSSYNWDGVSRGVLVAALIVFVMIPEAILSLFIVSVFLLYFYCCYATRTWS